MRTGTVAIVTGGTRGIGAAVAQRLSQDGYVVFTCGRKKKVSRSQRKTSIQVIDCDVGAPLEVTKFVAEVRRRVGPISILVNNAGIVSRSTRLGRQPVETVTDQAWDSVLKTNLYGAFYMCRSVTPGMKQQRFGRIINIGSAASRLGGILSSVDYISSKAGLIGLTRGLAYELGAYNITVNAVLPGRVHTGMLAEGLEPWALRHVPLQRLGLPSDIAGCVSFLASSDADYITGASLDVNGGWIFTP